MKKNQAYLINPTSLGAMALALVACGGGSDEATPTVAAPPVLTAAQSCTTLNGLSIPAASIGLPSTGASVSSAELIAASGSGAASLGEYCKVIGSIGPVDASAPPIRFQVHLPTNWNKKTMQFGGGGYDGELGVFLNVVHSGPSDQLTPQGRGYAVFGSDSGHTQNSTFIYGRDASFGVNDEALKNFASEALKKTRDAAVFVVAARYHQAAQNAYFYGGSSGGREALAVVQKWPKDYDGVISMFPAWNSAAMTLQFGRITRALARPGAYLNVAKRTLVFKAAMAACDDLDGVADGLISNVAACNAKFDPATASVDGSANGKPLRCGGGIESGDTCLSDAQIGFLKVVNTPANFNFTLASGETQYPGYNTWGTDLGIPSTKPGLGLVPILGLNADQPADPIGITMPYMAVYWDQWVKYFVTRDAKFNSLTLDPENPGSWAARISALSALQDINNPQLSEFFNKGGKLLMAHGSADGLVSTRATAQYYERLKLTMGGLTVDSFVRYYEIPGYGHSATAAFNTGWDSVTALENWVERGYAPANQVATDKTGVPGRTRPLCDYPTWPKYNGAGEANFASSFTCVK